MFPLVQYNIMLNLVFYWMTVWYFLKNILIKVLQRLAKRINLTLNHLATYICSKH